MEGNSIVCLSVKLTATICSLSTTFLDFSCPFYNMTLHTLTGLQGSRSTSNLMHMHSLVSPQIATRTPVHDHSWCEGIPPEGNTNLEAASWNSERQRSKAAPPYRCSWLLLGVTPSVKPGHCKSHTCY